MSPRPNSKATNLVIETNLARAPAFSVTCSTTAGDRDQVMYRQSFVLTGTPATVRDIAVAVHLCTLFVREGCPTDNIVRSSLRAISAAMGHHGSGGRNARLARDAVSRLSAARFESAILRGKALETRSWGVIARSPASAHSHSLDPLLASLLRDNHVTYLSESTASGLIVADPVAFRLWVFLEAERLTHPFTYPLFASRRAKCTPWLPAISNLLLSRDSNPRRFAKRVHAACSVICDADPRYVIRVEHGAVGGGWNLVATRRRADSGVHETGTHTYASADSEVRASVQMAVGPSVSPIEETTKSANSSVKPTAVDLCVADEVQLIEKVVCEHGWPGLSERQRRLVECIVRRGLDAGCCGHSEIVEEAFATFSSDGVDPLSVLKWHDEIVHPRSIGLLDQGETGEGMPRSDPSATFGAVSANPGEFDWVAKTSPDGDGRMSAMLTRVAPDGCGDMKAWIGNNLPAWDTPFGRRYPDPMSFLEAFETRYLEQVSA